MNTVQPRNLREASLWSSSLRSAWNAHLRRKPRGREFSKLSREHDGYTRWMGWSRVTRGYERSDGNVEHACTCSWNARGTLVRRNHPERLPGRRRRSLLVVESPPRRPVPHHGSRFESREKWVEKLYGVWSADYWTGTGRKDASDSIYTAWIPLRTTGDFLMGQNNRWRRESMIIWKFIFFFYYRVLYLSCLVLWNFCTCNGQFFFVILINCSLVILSSFELEVFRSNF